LVIRPVKWLTITPNRAAIPSLRRFTKRSRYQTVAPNRSEADMRYITIRGQHSGHHTVTAAFWLVAACWVLAGIVAVMALGGGLTRLAVALAIVTTEWWILSGVEHRVERNHAKMRPVTHLRPSQRDLKKISAHALWRGPCG
jgi:Flp pilus assembly protein TadB